MDTYEEEEGGHDIDSSDSDNNDGDLGELTLNADNAVAAAGAEYSGYLSPGLGPPAETAGRWMVMIMMNRGNEDMSWLDPNNTLDCDKI